MISHFTDSIKVLGNYLKPVSIPNSRPLLCGPKKILVAQISKVTSVLFINSIELFTRHLKLLISIKVFISTQILLFSFYDICSAANAGRHSKLIE